MKRMRGWFAALILAVPAGAAEYTILTLAGNGAEGYSGDGGGAPCATLNRPTGVDVDGAGFIYIADYGNNRIRRVSPEGVIATVAGNGERGFSGDGGPATSAQLAGPYAVRVVDDGFLIADAINGRIRHVNRDGVIRTIAGGRTGEGIGDGGPATNARLQHPVDVIMGPDRALFVAEGGGNRVRRIGTDGIITTFAGSGRLRYNGQSGYGGDGGPATAALLNVPASMAFDAEGNLFIGDLRNHVVRRVSRDGIITTVARGFNEPGGLAFEADGSLLIADIPHVRRLKSDGTLTVVAGTGKRGFYGDHGPAANADLSVLDLMAIDVAGNVYVADHRNSRIRKLVPVREVTSTATARVAATADVEELLSRMRAAYQTIEAAAVRFNVLRAGRRIDGTLRYERPGTVTATLQVEEYGTVRVAADGQLIRVIDPQLAAPEELTWSLQNLRTAVAANLEVISLWDSQRQLSTGEGGNMRGETLRLGKAEEWRGKRWIVLEERAGSDLYRYWVDPKTSLIHRTAASRHSGDLFYEGIVERLSVRRTGERARK
jgi:sugar lactone lactonase YvrE